MIKIHSVLGKEEIIYFDQEKDGEYAFIDGKWIYLEDEIKLL